MTKAILTELTDKRIRLLESRYMQASENKDSRGKDIRKATATVLRARIKRDLQLLMLIKELLGHCEDFTLRCEDAYDGFIKLVEPFERYHEPKKEDSNAGD